MKSINTTSTTAALTTAPQTIEIIVNRNHNTTPADALAFIGGQANISSSGDSIDIDSSDEYEYRVTADEDLIEEAELELADKIARHLGTNLEDADVSVRHEVDFTPGFKGARFEVIVDGEITDLHTNEIEFTPLQLVEFAPRYLDDQEWADLKSESGFTKVVRDMDADSEVDGEKLAALLAGEDIEMPENEFGTELLISSEQVEDFYNMVNAHREADRHTAKELKIALKTLGEEQLADLADLDDEDEITFRVQGFSERHDAEITVKRARKIIEETGFLDHTDVLDHLNLSDRVNLSRDISNYWDEMLDGDETDKELTLRLLGMRNHGWSSNSDEEVFEVPIRF